MNLKIIKMFFAYPFTIAIMALMVIFGLMFNLWFHPPLIINLLYLVLNFVLFFVWWVIALGSDYFIKYATGIFQRIDMNEFQNNLKSVSPEFKLKANQCIKLIYSITKEFKNKMTPEELGSLVDNICLLAVNNKNLYQRYLQFGNQEQKSIMKNKIDEQVKSLSSTLEMLQAFSGNLSLLDANNTQVSDGSIKLKYINQSLQDLIKVTENDGI
jgi:hypothetical protein